MIATIYTIVSFNDDEQARAYLGLLGAIATGGVAILLGKLTKDALEHKNAMQDRVGKACPGGSR